MRWTPEEKQLVIDSNESAAILATRLNRTADAVQNIRDKHRAAGGITKNDIRNQIHDILLKHSEQVIDEIDVVLGFTTTPRGLDSRILNDGL